MERYWRIVDGRGEPGVSRSGSTAPASHVTIHGRNGDPYVDSKGHSVILPKRGLGP